MGLTLADAKTKRWRVENPGDDPDRVGLKVMLISWLDPQPNAE
jgi:hypothetical protein